MSDLPRKSVETFIYRFATQAVLILAGIVTARALGPYGKGIFAYATNVFAFFFAFNAGQAAAISWQYGRLKRPSGAVLSAMLRIMALVCVPFVLVLMVLALTFPGQWPLFAVILATPFACFSQMANAFYLADGKIRTQNIQNFVRAVALLLGLGLVLLVFHLGVSAMLAIWVLSYVAAATYALVMLAPYAKAVRNSSLHLKEQLVFGLKASGNSLVAFLNFNIDIYLVLFILGPKALGIYAVAIGGGQGMWQLTQPLVLSAYGRINSGSFDESSMLTAKCVRHALVVVGVGCILLFFLAPSLITLVYGIPFASAGGVLRYLLPGIIAYSMVPFFANFFSQQLGKPLLPMWILGISTIICAIITLALIRSLGITAGAIATSVSYCAALVLCIVLFIKETGVPASNLFQFRRDDLRPYKSLLFSLWARATDVTTSSGSSR